MNIPLNVIVNGGTHEDAKLVASVTLVDGRLSLRHSYRKVLYPLEPEWVTPKYASPSHDNGLVVIIKGEHRGKYMRRVHHSGRGPLALMIGAVIKRIEGSADVVTDERLEVGSDCLCTVHETKDQIKLNKHIMENICIAYRQNMRS